MNNAQEFITDNQSFFTESRGGYECSYSDIDNNTLIELIDEASTSVLDILDQETFTFSDDSYITRNGDQYWDGDDVSDFLLTEESIARPNKEFECAILKACKENLKDADNAETYAKMTLDELWDGSNYSDSNGTLNYFEIPGAHTHHGRPVVVSV